MGVRPCIPVAVRATRRCREQIAGHDNIPIVSYLLLGGRCRKCKAPIPLRYFVIELLTAVSFVAVALARGLELDLVVLLPFVAMLVAGGVLPRELHYSGDDE